MNYYKRMKDNDLPVLIGFEEMANAADRGPRTIQGWLEAKLFKARRWPPGNARPSTWITTTAEIERARMASEEKHSERTRK